MAVNAKMKKHNAAYWKKRFQALENSQYQKTVAYYKDVQEQFRRATNDIQMDIEKWYRRLADNNEISLAAAKKLLKRSELEEFHWTVEEYIKYGEENALNARWMKQLENASAKVHISRLEAMKLQMQQHAELLFAEYEGGITDFLHNSFKENYYHTAFELAKGTEIGTNLHKIDTRKIDTIIKQPWAADGSNFSERIWKNKEYLVNNLYTELTQNIIRGATPQQAIDNLANQMNVSKRQAGKLLMTESAAISAAADYQCYRELGIEKYEILATLDNLTSKICQEMDGKVFELKDYEIGLTAPPFHPNCRSTTIPYFEDEFTKGEKRAARSEETKETYYVPSTMTYKEWKEEFIDKKVQKLKTWKIDEEELNYRKIELDTKNTETFVRQSEYLIEAYKVIDSPYSMYFSKNARKPTRTINYYEKLIKQVETDFKFDISKMEKPNYVIVNGITEMKDGTAATYAKKYNTIFLLDNTNTNQRMVNLQIGEDEHRYACSDNPKSTLMHEMIHWYQFQRAKQKSESLEEVKKIIDDQEEKILAYAQKIGYNFVQGISGYAQQTIILGIPKTDELIAEAMVCFHYGDVNKLVTFVRKELEK